MYLPHKRILNIQWTNSYTALITVLHNKYCKWYLSDYHACFQVLFCLNEFVHLYHKMSISLDSDNKNPIKRNYNWNMVIQTCIMVLHWRELIKLSYVRNHCSKQQTYLNESTLYLCVCISFLIHTKTHWNLSSVLYF